ncbi:MAG: hypothetical protein H6Q05_4164 [Acidobacteria bacterium]|nr:hypothetical protein [Acidobacteriota bacterium]
MTARHFFRCVALIALLSSVAAAQDGKRVVTYTGTIKDAAGMPRLGSVGIAVSLYAEQEGGEPLWRESQTVQLDNEGRYTLLIGATEREGLPLEVFADRKAQWLGIQEEGEAEQPRILLLTVPYALKAADADTVGGRPLSSFVLYEDLEKGGDKSLRAATIVVPERVQLAGTGILQGAEPRSGIVRSPLMNATPGRVAASEGGEPYYNTLYGLGAGSALTYRGDNSFFGAESGFNTTIGFANSFFGRDAGWYNTSGYENSFFGRSAGYGNTTGSNNSFFGGGAGFCGTTGTVNSFFGDHAGFWTTTGIANSFFGANTANFNTTGSYNLFLGAGSGNSNSTEDNNSFIGTLSDGAAGITNATAIGYQAKVTESNSLVLGSIYGLNGATADTNVGIGTSAPAGKLHVKGGAAELFYVGVNGDAGVGTAAPDKRVQITGRPGRNAELHIGGSGDELTDVFAGMGTNLDAGPAFNYGYAGHTFGRSAGFFNVRPDPSATPPNPSLRFMTANQQRMIITNTGDVGIGTVEPKSKVHAEGGAIYVGSPGEGIILKSPSGLMCVKLTVDNSGFPVFTTMACP